VSTPDLLAALGPVLRALGDLGAGDLLGRVLEEADLAGNLPL
jgi:hypothetical protein